MLRGERASQRRRQRQACKCQSQAQVQAQVPPSTAARRTRWSLQAAAAQKRDLHRHRECHGQPSECWLRGCWCCGFGRHRQLPEQARSHLDRQTRRTCTRGLRPLPAQQRTRRWSSWRGLHPIATEILIQCWPLKKPAAGLNRSEAATATAIQIRMSATGRPLADLLRRLRLRHSGLQSALALAAGVSNGRSCRHRLPLR